MPVPWSAERDLALRRAAMARLALLTNDGDGAVGSETLKDFRFEGRRVPLIDNQRGIRKPAGMLAALSIRTVFRREGQARPYDDALGADGLIRYKWRGDDPDHPENAALRAAWRLDLPLIWFIGVDVGLSKPVFPVRIVGEEPDRRQFVVWQGERGELPLELGHLSAGEQDLMRRYVARETWQRVHQPVFRARVLHAYRTACAVCSIRHAPLLDAAHILGDREEGGEPTLRNGLALCKIHHAAFDGRLMGISPDYVVRVRPDILVEVDGPMLLHGLQGRHDQRLLVLPDRRGDRPDRERLERRFAEFEAWAG